MTFTPRLEQAIRVAATAHRNQHRKGTDTPYISHPFSVMTIASSVTDDEDVLIACLFHDIIEDVPGEYSEQLMRQEFGDRVVETVLGVTKDDRLKDWRQVSEAYLKHLQESANDGSVIVSAADKIHNLMSTISDYDEVGEELWDIFSTKSGADQLWWYESILDVICARGVDKRLSDQLAELVQQLRARLDTQAITSPLQ